MPDLSEKIVEFVADAYEHLFDQSLRRFLTREEQNLLGRAQEIVSQFELEERLMNSGLFTGVLSNSDQEKN